MRSIHFPKKEWQKKWYNIYKEKSMNFISCFPILQTRIWILSKPVANQQNYDMTKHLYSVLCRVSHWQERAGDWTTISNLPLRMLSLRHRKWPPQGHSASNWWSSGSQPCSPVSHAFSRHHLRLPRVDGTLHCVTPRYFFSCLTSSVVSKTNSLQCNILNS